MSKVFNDPLEQLIISFLPKKYQKALLLMELGYALSDVTKDLVVAYSHPDTVDKMSEEKIDDFFEYLESVAVNLKKFTKQLPAEIKEYDSLF